MAVYQEVPAFRPNPVISPIKIGAPVRAAQLIDTARLIHWIRARGYSVVPWQACDVELTSGSEILRFRCEPSGLAIARRWGVVLRSDGAGEVDINPGSEPTVRVSPPSSRRATGRAAFIYDEPLASKSAAVQELTFTVAHVSGTKTYIDAIGCWEIPRALIKVEDTGDRGIDLRSLEPTRGIVDATAAQIHGVAKAVANTEARRILHEQWFSTCKVTSAIYADIFPIAPHVVPTKRLRSSTTQSCKFDVYARVSDAGTQGNIKIVSGASSQVIALNGATGGHTSFAWRGGGGSDVISIPCEDLTDPAGLPSGTWPTYKVQIQRTAGAGNVEIKGVCLWEPVP